jgi:hypothetical protein
MSETDRVLGRIKQTLDELSKEISNGKYAAEFLTDLKGSVDQLRLTMWAVIETEDQHRHKDTKGPMKLNEKLVEFRIKRIVQMLNDLGTDAAIPEKSDLEALMGAFGTALQSVERRSRLN